jgi:hypothetical protein
MLNGGVINPADATLPPLSTVQRWKAGLGVRRLEERAADTKDEVVPRLVA